MRHVRIIQRGGTSGGTISPSRVITPPEIPALKKGMASNVFIGITFASASDRDGVTVAKFDVKSDRGTTSIEIRPSLGELLVKEATKTKSQTEFDTAISGLQGIQRITSTFTIAAINDDKFNNLPKTIMQHLNLVSSHPRFLLFFASATTIADVNITFLLFRKRLEFGLEKVLLSAHCQLVGRRSMPLSNVTL